MKKLNYIIALLLCGVAFSACSDSSSMLDKEDVGDLYEKDVFRNYAYALSFVNDIYFNQPNTGYDVSNSWFGAYLDCATDNGEARRLDSDAQRFNNGHWNAEVVPMGGAWSRDYAQIRACNKFFANQHLLQPIETISTIEQINYLAAEVVFLRALFYADMLRNFGGVPLITSVLDKNDPLLKVPRSDFSTLVEYVVHQCDSAAMLFSNINLGEVDNFGRANRGVALSLKARVLTMAASPLFNRPPSYPQYDSNDPNVALWRYPDYSRERWNRAALALEDVVNLNQYSLYTAKTGTKTAYETYFVTRATPTESIYPMLKGPSIDIYYNNLPFEFMLIRGKGTPVCHNLPSYDLVCAYEMANGMLPEQVGSGYRPLSPFSGRDPRLEGTIWHDESLFCGIEFQTWRREITSKKSSGKDYITGYSRTGFYLKKYMDKDLNPSNAVTLPNSYPVIRYADILLMLAEARNEYADVPDNIVCDPIDQVRSRAGMPSVAISLENRGWAMTQENVRKLIQNERRIEFAFEEHRFWDVRRWMIAHETQKVVHELDIVLKDDDRTKIYTKKQIEKRFFEDRMHMMPLPQVEVNRNKALHQNWGWSPININ